MRGFYGADDMYMHGQIYHHDLLIGKQLHITWYTWATRYTDGTLDAGHFMLGHDGLGMLLLCDETGAVNRTTDVNGIVELDSTGTWPARIEVHAPGQWWEFLPDAKGRMVDFMPIPNPQAEGRWRRVGDTREPAHWFAYGEVAPSHGTVPRRGVAIPEMVDPSTIEARRNRLERWLAGAIPSATSITLSPFVAATSGFSNLTLFTDLRWSDPRTRRAELVLRVQPRTEDCSPTTICGCNTT